MLHYSFAVKVNMSHPSYDGGCSPKFCTWMCLLASKKSLFPIPIKAQLWDPSIYHFLQKNTQFGSHWVLFWQNSQITPNFANWAHWVSDGNPPIDIPNFMKVHPKRLDTSIYYPWLVDGIKLGTFNRRQSYARKKHSTIMPIIPAHPSTEDRSAENIALIFTT